MKKYRATITIYIEASSKDSAEQIVDQLFNNNVDMFEAAATDVTEVAKIPDSRQIYREE